MKMIKKLASSDGMPRETKRGSAGLASPSYLVMEGALYASDRQDGGS